MCKQLVALGDFRAHLCTMVAFDCRVDELVGEGVGNVVESLFEENWEP